MPNLGNLEVHQPLMELHELIFIPLIGILGLLLQLKYAAENASPFVTDHVTMLAFIVVFIVYFGVLAAKLVSRPTRNSDMAKFMTNIILLSGSLASILLMKFLVPAYGWFALFCWVIYLIKDVVTKESYWKAIVHVFGKVKELIYGPSAEGERNVVQPPPVPEVVVPIQDEGQHTVVQQRTTEESTEPCCTPLNNAAGSQPEGLIASIRCSDHASTAN